LSFFCIKLVYAHALKIMHEHIASVACLCVHGHHVYPLCAARLTAFCVPHYRAGLAGPALAWSWLGTAGRWPAVGSCVILAVASTASCELRCPTAADALPHRRCCVTATACNCACVGLAGYRPLWRCRLNVTSAYALSRCRGRRLAIYGIVVAHTTPRYPIASTRTF
jgi:hypothetical protein